MEEKAEYVTHNASRYDTWRSMIDEWARHHQARNDDGLMLVIALALVDIAENTHRMAPGRYDRFPLDLREE